jgi:membrane protein insertase Oxa1/YidC/SpoIIIJ
LQHVESALYWLHAHADMPWWATIVTVTLALRMALAVVNVRLLRNSTRMKFVQPALEE